MADRLRKHRPRVLALSLAAELDGILSRYRNIVGKSLNEATQPNDFRGG